MRRQSAGGGDAVAQARAWLATRVGEEAVPDPAAPPPQAGPTAPIADLDPQGEVEPEALSGPDPDADADADAESVARAILLRQLAAQDRTRSELAAALRKKNVPVEVADRLLDRFAETGLVDDRAFARRWVESRQGRRHRSRLALRRELVGKGVERDLVDEALSEVRAEDEEDAARAFVERSLPAMRSLDPAVRYRRLADRLARRGFGPEVIGRALNDLPRH